VDKNTQWRAKHRHKAIIEKISSWPLSIFLKLDPSGKSPAYVDGRKNQPAAGKVAGFFNRAVFAGALLNRTGREFVTVTAVRFLRLDPSGKSPAYVHHRSN
jgi:hypothetical protein